MNYDEKDRARFLTKFQASTDGLGCWEWRGAFFMQKELPYGSFYVALNGKESTVSAHRASYRFFRGEIPNGLHVLHSCNNSKCVNPVHLRLGTHIDNMKDRDDAGRTSKWDKRYNFKRSQTLIDAIKGSIGNGLTVAETCKKLSIGWQTFYRAREQDTSLRELIARTKSQRYSFAAKQRRA